MDYVEPPNSNLVCCICHAPFINPTTARTCLHTFCHDCITVAVGHSPQCPIDRSSLSIEDLFPANPIVKHLVDELIVECPNTLSGCTQTFQRQLSSHHIKNACQYAEVQCSEGQCEKMILRKDIGNHKDACLHRSTQCDGCGGTIKYSDLSTHNSECSSKSATCTYCFEEFPRLQSQAHAATCPEYEIQCTHANNGCPWSGPRQLSGEHTLSCPYEAIKGFFAINSAQISALSAENAALRQKIHLLESVVLTTRRDIQTFRNVLGPWYRPDIQISPIASTSIDALEQFTLSTTAGPSSSRNTLNQTHTFSPTDQGESIFPSPGGHHEVDVLAPFFPFPPEHTLPESNTYPRSHRSFSGLADPLMTQRTVPLTPVAPLNLSTSLEGSLSGLRDSVAAVSASVDALARRNDIALTNESMRVNEELGSLKYAVHGIRLQLHRLMMDRNAQVTGRPGEPPLPTTHPCQPTLQSQMMASPFPATPGTKL